jgi:hypothetical protein
MRGRLPTYAASLALIAILGPAPAADAQNLVKRNAMNRNEIVAAFANRQLSGIYPSGLPWSELIRSDGTSDYREGERRREGRWWMRGHNFCFSYAPPMSGGCFRVVRIGTNCYELYAVNPGDGPSPAPGADEDWNGRMWRDDVPPTCEEQPTS